MSSLRSWLGFAAKFDFSKARSLGACVGVVLVLLVGSLFALAVITAFKVLVTSLFGELPQGASASFGLTGIIVAMISAPFVIWRTMVAQKQTDVAEQGMITERIMKAVEGLGAEKIIKVKQGEKTVPNLEVRIGAIYSLERIAQDSLRDHIQIMEILCAYVRNNFPAMSLNPEDDKTERPKPRADLQTIVSVIGRRNTEQIAIEHHKRQRLDFNYCDLSGCDFTNSDFSGATFHSCRIEFAFMGAAKMRGTQFIGALLNHTHFRRTDLTGASLEKAIISYPRPLLGGMSESITFSENTGLNVSGANISAIDYLGEPDKANQIIGSADTVLSETLEEQREACRQMQIQYRKAKPSNDSDADEQRKKLWDTGFMYWANHRGLSGHQHKKFLYKHGLTGFPYFDD